MLPYIENILQTLTGKSSFNDVSEDELKQIADKYPYFSATQFLLGKKILHQKTTESKAAVQKAALHFTDVLWLHYNLVEEEDVTTVTKTPTVQEILAEAEVVLNEEENILKEHAQYSAGDEYGNYTAAETANTIEEISEPQSIDKNNVEELTATVSETQPAELLDEPETEPNEKLSNLLKEQVAAFEKPAEETVLPVEATAYHRIDYFESQGIKLDEEKANDKLGTQLKRFTDWLKQMKKINSNLNNLETDAAGESQVQNMAEHSNEPKEIVTEAMAEVLVKQGKPEQAMQIYEKLSFSNPSKSAYFAAKIQELKP
jgi:hypothetical protein